MPILMRCERFWTTIVLVMTVACSREATVPPQDATTASTAPAATTSSATTTTAPIPQAPIPSTDGSYAKGMDWLRSAKAFHFVLDEAGVHAEGDLQRKTIGAEQMQFRANNEEWRATASARGVTWERRNGAKWVTADPPSFGNRVYQRVTLAFDPQKKEGDAQLVGDEDGANHYRFTNANTGEIHEVWVSTADEHVTKMKIGETFAMVVTISPER